jgi:transposase
MRSFSSSFTGTKAEILEILDSNGYDLKAPEGAGVPAQNLDASMYASIVMTDINPGCARVEQENGLAPGTLRVMEDADPKHVKARKDLEDTVGYVDNTMSPPLAPCSPDINPIEDFWSWFKSRLAVDQPRPKNPVELRRNIYAQWETVTAPDCARFINSMGKRLKKVIELKGIPSDKHL